MPLIFGCILSHNVEENQPRFDRIDLLIHISCQIFYTGFINCTETIHVSKFVCHCCWFIGKTKTFITVCPNGFQCDFRRCIPKDWQCDGHIDCKDQSDELNCTKCGTGMVHCGYDKCINQEHMCDGKVDCPWGQDERNCRKYSHGKSWKQFLKSPF